MRRGAVFRCRQVANCAKFDSHDLVLRNVTKKSEKQDKKNSFSLGGSMPVGAIAHEAQRGSWGNAIAAGLRDLNQRVVGL